MTRSSSAALVLACVMLGTAPAMSAAPPIPVSAEKAYTALASRVDGDTAMEVVRFMDQYWRIAGNPGFNASIDHIRERLTQNGCAFTERTLTGAGKHLVLLKDPDGVEMELAFGLSEVVAPD